LINKGIRGVELARHRLSRRFCVQYETYLVTKPPSEIGSTFSRVSDGSVGNPFGNLSWKSGQTAYH
jgi:hypothetical protein